MRYVKGEEGTVLGLMLGGVVGVVGHMLAMENRAKGLSIVGGKYDHSKLALIAVLAKNNKVALLGQLGHVFAVAKH